MTDEERATIFLIESFEKDDLVDIHNLIQKYEISAAGREYSAQWINDPQYKKLCIILAEYDRKVVEALKTWK